MLPLIIIMITLLLITILIAAIFPRCRLRLGGPLGRPPMQLPQGPERSHAADKAGDFGPGERPGNGLLIVRHDDSLLVEDPTLPPWLLSFTRLTESARGTGSPHVENHAELKQ